MQKPTEPKTNMTEAETQDKALRDLIRARSNARKIYWKQFQDTFSQPLQAYWDSDLLGLDIVKLDRVLIGSGESKSIIQAIRENYGEEAVSMVLALS